MNFPKKLRKKLLDRQENGMIRALPKPTDWVDFSSNDYLGFAKSEWIFNKAHQYLLENKLMHNGSTGSRLITGNHSLYSALENLLCAQHNSNSALVFNSGYDANIGFFSAVPQRGDVILFDELIHASIKDGIRLSHGKAYKFKHNNPHDLKKQLQKYQNHFDNIFVVTESVFSMDGDSPNLDAFIALKNSFSFYLVVDEAHALGILGNNHLGLVEPKDVFAKIITFGKAFGVHGAAILSGKELRDYLLNFARSFIYTTGLPPHSLASILMAYKNLKDSPNPKKLKNNIAFFKEEINRLGISNAFIPSGSAIQSFVISGNQRVQNVAHYLQKNGFYVKAILSPTVPKGQERIRFCLHAYNTYQQVTKVLSLLRIFVFNQCK